MPAPRYTPSARALAHLRWSSPRFVDYARPELRTPGCAKPTGNLPFVTDVSAPPPRAASRRPTTPRRPRPSASGHVVPGMVGGGVVSGRGWHGMQGVRGDRKG